MTITQDLAADAVTPEPDDRPTGRRRRAGGGLGRYLLIRFLLIFPTVFMVLFGPIIYQALFNT